MPKGDDELRSVRIEVEGAVGAVPDAPDSRSDAGGSSGPPKWAIALAVLVVGLVGAVVLSLQPDGDAAADGTERQAPTTTVPGEDDADDGDDVDAPDEATESLDLTNSTEVVLTPLVSNGRIWQIIAADVGFFALTNDSGPVPGILRSVDGEDWFEVNTTVTTIDGPNTENLSWANLSPFDGRFALTAVANRPSELPDSTIFVSQTGDDWEELTLGSSQDPPFFPIQFSEDSVFGVQFRELRYLDDFIADVTTLDIPESGVCQVLNPAIEDGDRFVRSIIGCEDDPFVGVVDASNINSAFSVDEVFSCLDVLPTLFAGPDFALDLIRLGIDEEGELAALGPVSLFDLPVVASEGRIVGIDSGQPDFDELSPCEDFVNFPAPIDPSIFVAGNSAPEPQRFPFPGESIGSETRTDLSVVGEVTVGGQSQLVAVFGEALWALNLETAEWSGPLTASATPFPSRFQREVFLSESRTRAYSVGERFLFTFDFVAGADGALEVIETNRPISSPSDQQQPINFASALFADDEVIFLGDGLEAWSLEVPPLPSE